MGQYAYVTPRSWVYFIRLGNRIKIGYSNDPLKRRGVIQGRILKIIPGGRDVEAQMHRRFAHLIDQGEWFCDGSDLVEFIDSLPPIMDPDGYAVEQHFPGRVISYERQRRLSDGRTLGMAVVRGEDGVDQRYGIFIEQDEDRCWLKAVHESEGIGPIIVKEPIDLTTLACAAGFG